MNPRQKKWTMADRGLLTREFARRSNAELAEMLGRTAQSVAAYAYKMGLKKGPQGIQWTQWQLDTLRTLFPTMFDRDVAKILGVSLRTVLRKARELGLEKEPGFQDKNRHEINRRASEALKAKYREGTCVSHFRKGKRNNPEGEFKAGHRENPESKAKRIASLKRTWARKKLEQRVHKNYGL